MGQKTNSNSIYIEKFFKPFCNATSNVLNMAFRTFLDSLEKRESKKSNSTFLAVEML